MEGHLLKEESFEQKRPSCVIQEEGTVSAKSLRSEQAELFEGPKGQRGGTTKHSLRCHERVWTRFSVMGDPRGGGR